MAKDVFCTIPPVLCLLFCISLSPLLSGAKKTLESWARSWFGRSCPSPWHPAPVCTGCHTYPPQKQLRHCLSWVKICVDWWFLLQGLLASPDHPPLFTWRESVWFNWQHISALFQGYLWDRIWAHTLCNPLLSIIGLLAIQTDNKLQFPFLPTPTSSISESAQ